MDYVPIPLSCFNYFHSFLEVQYRSALIIVDSHYQSFSQ